MQMQKVIYCSPLGAKQVWIEKVNEIYCVYAKLVRGRCKVKLLHRSPLPLALEWGGSEAVAPKIVVVRPSLMEACSKYLASLQCPLEGIQVSHALIVDVLCYGYLHKYINYIPKKLPLWVLPKECAASYLFGIMCGIVADAQAKVYEDNKESKENKRIMLKEVYAAEYIEADSELNTMIAVERLM